MSEYTLSKDAAKEIGQNGGFVKPERNEWTYTHRNGRWQRWVVNKETGEGSWIDSTYMNPEIYLQDIASSYHWGKWKEMPDPSKQQTA